MNNRKIRRRSFLFAPLCFIAICAVFIFGLSVFFRVSEIIIEGNSVYSDEEVISASNLEIGDNLFFINTVQSASGIIGKLPYMDKAIVQRQFPQTIKITVSESVAIAKLRSETEGWSIDHSGKVLARLGTNDGAGLINVIGVTAVDPKEGSIITAASGESAKISFLTELLTGMDEYGMSSQISYIDMSNPASPEFDYLGRFTVKFGDGKDVDYKIRLLLAAINEMKPGDNGILDLSIDNRVHLTYN